MTSSLVGSEMCIRDRTRGVVIGHMPGWDSRRCRRSAGAAAGSGRPHEEAVSYTHLTLPTICSV
eukprot:194063-Prorocentrum_lima.AAC.1